MPKPKSTYNKTYYTAHCEEIKRKARERYAENSESIKVKSLERYYKNKANEKN